jgi:hypothetical protein
VALQNPQRTGCRNCVLTVGLNSSGLLTLPSRAGRSIGRRPLSLKRKRPIAPSQKENHMSSAIISAIAAFVAEKILRATGNRTAASWLRVVQDAFCLSVRGFVSPPIGEALPDDAGYRLRHAFRIARPRPNVLAALMSRFRQPSLLV